MKRRKTIFEQDAPEGKYRLRLTTPLEVKIGDELLLDIRIMDTQPHLVKAINRRTGVFGQDVISFTVNQGGDTFDTFDFAVENGGSFDIWRKYTDFELAQDKFCPDDKMWSEVTEERYVKDFLRENKGLVKGLGKPIKKSSFILLCDRSKSAIYVCHKKMLKNIKT